LTPPSSHGEELRSAVSSASWSGEVSEQGLVDCGKADSLGGRREPAQVRLQPERLAAVHAQRLERSLSS
jgi:hypothetical protein